VGALSLTGLGKWSKAGPNLREAPPGWLMAWQWRMVRGGWQMAGGVVNGGWRGGSWRGAPLGLCRHKGPGPTVPCHDPSTRASSDPP
jgi:hypothetical protein